MITKGDPRGVFYDIETDPEVAARLTARALGADRQGTARVVYPAGPNPSQRISSLVARPTDAAMPPS